MEYPLDHTFEHIPTSPVECPAGDDVLLLIPESASWVLVNPIQYDLYKELRRPAPIRTALNATCRRLKCTFAQALQEMQVFISMASNNGFLDTTPRERAFEKELVLYLTEDCNIRCRHCFLSAGSNKWTLSLATVERHPIEYSSIKPNGKVLLTGGEPFLHPELGQIIDRSHSLDLRVSVNTNGTLITHDWLERFGPKLYGLQISIDGFTPVVHDTIRGRGSFAKSWEGLTCCLETLPEDVVIRISVSVFPGNVQNIKDEMVAALRSLDPGRRIVVLFNPVAAIGRAETSQATSNAFIRSALRHTFNELDANGWPTGTDVESSIRQRKCGIGEYIVVRANGTMTPCNFSGDARTFATLGDGFDVFGREYGQMSVDASPVCADCIVRYVCFGGCQVVNALEGDGPLAPRCGSDRIASVLALMIDDERLHRREIEADLQGGIE